MAKLTEYMGLLIDLMKSHGVDRDTCVGIIVTLRTEDNYQNMFNWLVQNPRADQTDIMQHHYSYLPTMPYFAFPVYKRRPV